MALMVRQGEWAIATHPSGGPTASPRECGGHLCDGHLTAPVLTVPDERSFPSGGVGFTIPVAVCVFLITGAESQHLPHSCPCMRVHYIKHQLTPRAAAVKEVPVDMNISQDSNIK